MRKQAKRVAVVIVFICALSIPTSVFASTGSAAYTQNYLQSLLDQLSSFLGGSTANYTNTGSNYYGSSGTNYYGSNYSGSKYYGDKDHNYWDKLWEEWCKKFQTPPPQESKDIWKDWYCDWIWDWDWGKDWDDKDWDNHDKDWDDYDWDDKDWRW